MALKKCKECGKEISTKAKECPHCGVPAKKKAGCGSIALVLLGLLIIISILGSLGSKESKTTTPEKSVGTSNKPISTWKERDNSLLAYGMIEDYVKNRLKSPSSADFPGLFDGKADHIQRLGGQKYRIVSWVDSQNAFGAMIRTRFVGEIEQMSEYRWSLISLQFIE